MAIPDDDIKQPSAMAEASKGFMQLLPMKLDIGLNISSMFMYPSPWQSVIAMGAEGDTQDESPQHQVLIAYEWPIPYLNVLSPISKADLERMHISRYITDALLATGQLPYETIDQGADPPDFVGITAGRGVGVECTSFTLTKRRRGQGLLEGVREAILREHRKSFAHLRGTVVYMWFAGDDDKEPLPPSKGRRAEIAEIISALREYQVDFSNLFVPYEEGPPDPAPELPLKRTDGGCSFYAFPMMNAVPSSRFFDTLGFEIGLAYTTRHSREEGWKDVVRAIEEHDKAGVEHLLITVGGPNRLGLGFLTEERIMDFLLSEPTPVAQSTHIRRVEAHFWSTGRIVRLLPEFRVISPALHGGFVPAHHRAPKSATPDS